jgi:hypothetical protein
MPFELKNSCAKLNSLNHISKKIALSEQFHNFEAILTAVKARIKLIFVLC